MQLVKHSPSREMQRIERDLDKLWQTGWGIFPTFTEVSTMDLYQEDGNLIAEVSLPNFKKEEVKVKTDEGVLEVSAEHKEEEKKKNKRQYYFHESSNSYFRRVTLPQGVKTDKADASFKDNVLRVTMPMTTSNKTKVVKVK